MESITKQYLSSSFHIVKTGHGSTVIICFHGYGEDSSYFNFLEKYIGEDYSLYAIDLPHHGQTKWNESKPFTTEDLINITGLIIPGSNDRFMVIGFSLGGRVALSLYQAIPERIEKLVLLAPDGLKVNGWYWLATQTWLGNRFFKLTMRKPGWFFGLLQLLNKLKWVNASIFKFVNYYIGDAEVRRLLYARWTSLRKIRPDISLIKEKIRILKTPVRLVYGKHDRIILAAVGEKFRKGIEEFCSLSVIHAGHQVLHEKHMEEILPALLH